MAIIDPNVKGEATASNSRIGAAMDALKSGNAAGLSSLAGVVSDKEVYEESEEVSSGEPLDSLFGSPAEGESDPVDSQSSTNPAQSQTAPVDGDIEEILVSDHQGRRKVKIDWNDRDDIKKKIQLAAGARKWQAERDKALAQAKQASTQWKEKAELFNELESVYESQGVEGLIDRLEGRRGAYQDFLRKQMERHELRRNATPEELETLDRQDAYEKQQREFDKIRKEHEKLRKEVESKEESARESQMLAKISPAFDRYRFAGKLGNADQETVLDNMIWNSALKKLQPYEDRGYEITQDLVNRAFQTASASIRKIVNLQTDQKVQKTLQKKKQEATENAQQLARKGVRQTSDDQAAREMVRRGDLMSFFQTYGKRINFGSNPK